MKGTHSWIRRAAFAGLLAAPALVVPRVADAFCGFYVAGGDARLYNNATVVVMLRDGTRTVLSMQNNYQGPPQDFAMVVPVPVILKEKDVKTLPREIFDTVDLLAAPRLVEYWEEDPCKPLIKYKPMAKGGGGAIPDPTAVDDVEKHGVKIEAQFTVGEYQILILSAQEATGLDAWLRENKYTIPAGAAEVLRPYVQAGMKFFVAKVDPSKVTFGPNGQAMLSPLRFHYDSETFNLPVRLGLLNSAGAQDLIVHIVARSRYELANYPNVTIPTNIEVKDGVRESFGQFYVSLFDATLAQNPKAVVTEYAWMANNCDPCPVQPLQVEELVTLGADVLPSVGQIDDSQRWSLPGEFVLTRLHARYGKENLGEDLVFREASGIVGGREVLAGEKVEQGPSPSSVNNFQARYIIRHLWEGAVLCLRPKFGRWGGPPAGKSGSQQPAVARDLAFADRTGSLSTYVAQDIPEIRLTMAAGEAPPVQPTGPVTPGIPVTVPPTRAATPGAAAGGGCGCAVDERGAGWLLLGLAAPGLRRRRR